MRKAKKSPYPEKLFVLGECGGGFGLVQAVDDLNDLAFEGTKVIGLYELKKVIKATVSKTIIEEGD